MAYISMSDLTLETIFNMVEWPYKEKKAPPQGRHAGRSAVSLKRFRKGEERRALREFGSLKGQPVKNTKTLSKTRVIHLYNDHGGEVLELVEHVEEVVT